MPSKWITLGILALGASQMSKKTKIKDEEEESDKAFAAANQSDKSSSWNIRQSDESVEDVLARKPEHLTNTQAAALIINAAEEDD